MAIWQNPSDGTLHDDMDGAALSLPSWPKGMVELTAAQAAAAQTPPSVPLKDQAQTELDLVTGPRGTAIRCFAAGVPFPAAWTTYVQQLRAIANGTDTTSTTLPIRPAYPAGT